MRRLTMSLSLTTALVACQGGGNDLDAGSGVDAGMEIDMHAADGMGGEIGDGGLGDDGLGGAGGTSVGGMGGEGGIDTPDPAPADSLLRFEPQFGAEAGRAYDAGWSVPFEDGPLVVMLCAVDDPRCEQPQIVREITPEETDGDPIMRSFGPQIEALLPAGDYNLMIMVDSPTSRQLGLGWQDDFFTRESAWGGMASEWDVMLSDPDQPLTPSEPPPPASRRITLQPDAPLDLGVLKLQHFHERDFLPELRSEAGIIAVATPSGLRLIDAETQTPVEVVPDSGVFEYTMVDAAGDALGGQICGLIQGTGSTVYLLFESNEGGHAGFAVPFDVATRTQSAQRIFFPQTGQGESIPCRGIAHAHAGREYLFVTNAPPSMVAGAEEGLWFAAIDDSQDVIAGIATRDTDPLYQAGINTLTARDDRLYFSVSPTPDDARFVPDESVGRHNVFIATFDTETGAPTLRANDTYTFLRGPEMGAGYRNGANDVPCGSEYGYAGVAVAPFHDGRNLLFLGACTEIAVFDTANGERLDYNGAALPGRPGIDATLFGQAFTQLALSPDGETLFALPQRKSPIAFFLERGSGGNRQTYNRMMLLPIDLSAGERPALSSQYAGANIDGYEGPTDLSPLNTPAADPGIDLNYAPYVRHQLQFMPDSAGSSFQSAAFPIGHTIAITPSSVWMRGSGAPGSGLGKGGDLAVYDLESAQAIFFPHDGHPFYRFWLNGVGGAETERFGFDLTPNRSADLTTRGVLYVP